MRELNFSMRRERSRYRFRKRRKRLLKFGTDLLALKQFAKLAWNKRKFIRMKYLISVLLTAVSLLAFAARSRTVSSQN